MDGTPVILPPDTIRAILDTTANWVSEKGQAFEDKLLSSRANDPKFAFLYPGDPYHGFYLQQVATRKRERLANEDQSLPSGAEQTANGNVSVSTETDAADKQDDETSTISKVAPEISKSRAAMVKEAAARPVPKEPPTPDIFSIVSNPEAQAPTTLELEVIKLTAQFAAKNGRGFLASITVREGRNPLFDFVTPGHHHFEIFNSLRGAYAQIISPDEEVQKLLSQVYIDTKKMIDRAYYRADWARAQELKEAETTNDDISAQAIDWGDFVVVETVRLDEDEVNLPAPISAKDIASELQKRERSAQAAEEEEEADMDIDMDEDDKNELSNPVIGDIPRDKVRKDYVPDIRPALASETGANKQLNVVLPSGQTVPVNEATESMKVHLLDPKFKEERSRAAEKNANQNLASNAEISKNIGLLNARKTEVFGHKDLQVAVAAQKEANPTVVAPPATVEPVTVPLPGEQQNNIAEDVVNLGHLNKKAKLQELEIEAPKTGIPDVGGPLLPAEEWISRVGSSARIRVQLPKHSNKDWGLNGRIVDLEVPLSATIAQLKATLAKETKCPANKQKIQVEGVGFLKDSQSLAHYNIRPGTTFLVEVKERGGKKK